jgi:ribA/ribD-fused uncharacterized protein
VTTSEKALMLCKAALFNDTIAFQAMLETEIPGKVKALGRTVVGFKEQVWFDALLTIAKEVVTQKFVANPPLARILSKTGKRIIAESTSRDVVWGTGRDTSDDRAFLPGQWVGTNVLGWALMEARDHVQSMELSVLPP